MPIVFLAFSGGADSSTLLAHFLAEGYAVRPVFFRYGSKHAAREEEAARKVVAHYGIAQPDIVDLSAMLSGGDSALMATSKREIPSGPAGYQAPGSLAATLVPGRNLLMASVLSSMAEAQALQKGHTAWIAMGMHGGDHALYPDCRPDFVDALKRTIHTGTEGRVELLAPFNGMTKTEIIRRGLALKTPYALTRSCYTEQEQACGMCATCRERLAAFVSAGSCDPISYAPDSQNC